MKIQPNFNIKIRGKSFPVFRSPVTKEMISELLVKGKHEIFFIHDQKKGKLQKYDFSSKLPAINKLNLNLSYNAIIKIGLTSVFAYWVYRMAKFSPVDSWKKSNSDWIKKHSNNINNPGMESNKIDKDGFKKNNGWVTDTTYES